MTAVDVAIVQPADGAVLVGAATVELIGRIAPPAELAGVTLYYRWYSSASPAAKDHYSLNEVALTDPAGPHAATLRIGSQAVTLAAGDQPDQDEAAQNNTRHGGVAGGAQGPNKCVVHVLRAAARMPVAGQSVSRASAVLTADAPLHWPDAEYQAMNRLCYHWRFEPDPPDGRAVADLVPAPDALQLDFIDAGPVVRYTGPLPGADLGGYTMRLRVEDVQHPDVGDATTVPVVIVS